MPYSRTLTAGLMAAILLSALNSSAQAARVEPQIKEKLVNTQQTAGLVSLGHVPTSSEGLVVLAESANVKIVRSASAATITVATNCPRNWNLTGGFVRQVGFAKPRQGVSMMSDALGSRAIVNGKVYVFPPGPMSGLSLGKDGVKVGGQKIEPIPGTDLPGTCASDGPDLVEIVVPDSYTGGLKLGLGNDSSADVSGWTGGKVEATILGKSSLSAGDLTSLDKVVLDVRGSGSAEVSDLSTKVLVANINGSGNVTVKKGAAETSNATIAGNGSIILKGTYKNLQQSVSGQGTIQVSK